MNLLEKIKAGTRNCIERACPETDITVRVRLLSNQDVLDASMAADKVFAAAGVDVSLQNIKAYEAEKEVQYLYRACTDTDDKPLAPNVAEFRRLLSVPVKEWLVGVYNELTAECNYAADTMPDEEFDALVEAVKKNPDTLSNVSSISTLKRLVRFLASAPVTLQTGNGRI